MTFFFHFKKRFKESLETETKGKLQLVTSTQHFKKYFLILDIFSYHVLSSEGSELKVKRNISQPNQSQQNLK